MPRTLPSLPQPILGPDLRTLARRLHLTRLCALWLLVGSLVSPPPVSWAQEGAAETLAQQRQRVQEDFHRGLEELADRAEARGWKQAADQARTWIIPRRPGLVYLFPVLDQLEDQAPVPAPPEVDAAWQREFTEFKQGHARQLFTLARSAAEAGHLALAWTLVHESLREDPDFAEPRAMLGFSRQKDGRWLRPAAAKKMQAGSQWHPKYGWILKTQLPRLEKGQRQFRGRWISAEAELEQRRASNSPWHVRTEHFEVVTDYGLEDGVELAARLQRFRNLWQQLFVTCVVPPDKLRMVLAGKAKLPNPQLRHRVVYFQDRETYNAHLIERQPRIAETLGIYFAEEQTAYFFAGKEQHPGTVWHEVTHQLLQESRPSTATVGLSANFWLVEGAACYTESLVDHGAYVTLGGREDGRLPAARQRALRDHFYVPLGELSRMGMGELQADQRLAPLYSQSAGLFTFLLHGREHAYWDGTLATLAELYRGEDGPESLARQLECSYATLDVAYHAWLTELEGNPSEPPPLR